MDLSKILYREVERIITAPEGQRNVTLNKVVYTLAGYQHLGLSREDALEACTRAGKQAGLTDSEIAGSFRSGWETGVLHPCEVTFTREERCYTPDDCIPADQLIDLDFLETPDIHAPEPATWNGANDLIRYLEALFEPTEFVGYCVDSQNDGEKWKPGFKHPCSLTAGELITELRKAQEIGAALGDYTLEAGAWIRFNPLDGKGVKDENVTDYRFALVEGDDCPIEKQAAIYDALELPCVARVHSGSKSLHAIVRINASTLGEWKQRVKYLYTVLEKNGLKVDKANSNPSRLSRLPGVYRAGKPQFLVGLTSGKPTFEDWQQFIEESKDNLPDFEPIQDVWDNLPPKAPELIGGVLRCGHKMLLAGPSKAGKSFLLLELAVAIAEGGTWLGFPVRQGKVLYVNLELDHASCLHRVKDLYNAMGKTPEHLDNLVLWHLRGKAIPLDQLTPHLIRRAKTGGYSAIILDPLYKILTGDENSAHEMAKFCNHFDAICSEVGCSAIYCHHHSKGQQGQKRSGDRASGSGVFLRDPDALIDLIELDMDDTTRQTIMDTYSGDGHTVSPTVSAWRIEGTLREFQPFGELRLLFDYPRHYADTAELLKDTHADGETVPLPPSKKDRIRHAVTAMDGDLAEGVPLDELCEYGGLDPDEIRSWCRNSRTPYHLGHDGKLRIERTHRPFELLWAFQETEQNKATTPNKMAEAMTCKVDKVREWLKAENKLFDWEPKQPVKLTKLGEQKISSVETNKDLLLDDEEYF